MSTSDNSMENNFVENKLLIKTPDAQDDEHSNSGGGICSQIIKSKTARLVSMLMLILIYFFAEVIVGNITNSLTLVADSFHMLSDALSLIVGLIAVRMSKRKAHESITPWLSKKPLYNTFGWGRFEVVGALINATFLLALCVSIFLESIEKFLEPSLVSQPVLVLAVGAGGLLINLVGLVLFGSHAHAGHDHGHGHSHNHSNNHSPNHSNNHSPNHSHSNGHSGHNGDVENQNSISIGANTQPVKPLVEDQQMNMRAVFLHVLGDALGSVIVMISAIVVWLVPHEKEVPTNALATLNATTTVPTTITVPINQWIMYLDPVMSIILVVIMIITTTPLFKQSSLILLQTVPKHIHLDSIEKKLRNIEGITQIHDFHIWQLTQEKLVATVHVQCDDPEQYVRLSKIMKEKLHDEGIHSTTVQPEFNNIITPYCDMVCAEDSCKTKVCCSVNERLNERHSGPLEERSTNEIGEVNCSSTEIQEQLAQIQSQTSVFNHEEDA